MAVTRPARKEALLSMVESRVLLLVAERLHAFAPAADLSRADAVLVVDDRVARIGRGTDLRTGLAASQIVELPGATLTPGFTDAHIHLTEWALARRQVDLSDARSPEHAVAAVAAHAAAHPPADWLRGFAWNPHHWGGAYPDRALLDRAFPDLPVVLQSHDMHALWLNGAALQRAGIDDATPDPAGGRIVRDIDGRATGVLLEYAAQLANRALPAPALSEMVDAVAAAQDALHRLGITGVHSFPGIHVPVPQPLAVLQALRAQNRLRLRALQHVSLDLLDDAIRLGLHSGFGDDWLRIGGVKMFLDGALGSRTAWMREPYEGTSDLGLNVLAPAEFEHHVMRAAAAGIATTVHAIGDAAVCLALDVLARAPRNLAVPHRIEHVQCCPGERFADAGRHGILCSVQPAHLISDWRAADRHWGTRARSAYA
ncbi:MAG: amidohydrolase, partial [Longimicrobiales bacterium]